MQLDVAGDRCVTIPVTSLSLPRTQSTNAVKDTLCCKYMRGKASNAHLLLIAIPSSCNTNAPPPLPPPANGLSQTQPALCGTELLYDAQCSMLNVNTDRELIPPWDH